MRLGASLSQSLPLAFEKSVRLLWHSPADPPAWRVWAQPTSMGQLKSLCWSVTMVRSSIGYSPGWRCVRRSLGYADPTSAFIS